VTAFNPHPYQTEALSFLRRQPYALLAMEMGLGKTVVTGTLLAEVLGACECRRALVIAPKRVATHTWPAEFAKWAHLRHLRVAYLTGHREERIANLRKDADVWVINRENLKWLVQAYVAAKRPWPFDLVVVDESTSIKNPDSERFKALKAVRKKGGIRRLILLTGTPITNSYHDLWSQVFLLDLGRRLFPTLTDFRNFAFDKDYAGHGYTIKGEPEKRWIQDRVDDLILVMRAGDLIQMPEMRVIDVPVSLPSDAWGLYRQMERKALATLHDGTVVDAANGGVVVNKLAQMANGIIYDEGRWYQLHDAKLEALDEIVEAAGGEPLMVVYHYRADRDRLAVRYPQARDAGDREALDAWNRREVPILLLHGASAGHGLNLQDGGHHIAWMGPTYSLEQWLQTNARLFRQGQKSPIVFVYRLMAMNTIDDDIKMTCDAKDGSLAGLMKRLSARGRPSAPVAQDALTG